MRDLTGQRFGRLSVKKFSHQDKRRCSFWLCRCDCGNSKKIRVDQLTRGVAKSCGCLQREKAAAWLHSRLTQKTINLRKERAQRTAKGLPRNRAVRDLTGKRFAMLKVIKFLKIDKTKQASLWLCQCDCGETTVISSSKLKITKSCGCLNETHGHSKNYKRSREYHSWSSMKSRCLNSNAPDYKRYGGRGIKICKRWLNSFENFLIDMGPRPKDRTLDRKNNNGNYTKNNCRWALPKDQSNNQRGRI